MSQSVDGVQPPGVNQARRMVMRVGFTVSLLLLFSPGAALAQEPPTFASGTELVQIEVRVTDREDEPVGDLELGDFVLEEDGRSQEVELFHFVGRAEGGPTPDAPSSPGTPAASPAPVGPQGYTWVYVAPEVQRAEEFARAAKPLKRFIEERITPGFFVSLGGLPFTDDKDLLLASLDRMVDEPLATGTAVVDPVLRLEGDLAFEREVAASLQRQNGVLTGFVGMHRDPVRTPRMDGAGSLVSVERIDRQIIFYGRLALLRYLHLIERMAAFPGKKVVLLFRSGLRLEPAHSELLDQIAAAALRHRVSFFTLDSRGLDARAPGGLGGGLKGNSGRSSQVDPFSFSVARNQSVNGLVTLAKATGGQSVVDANDPGSILQKLLEESSNYYVLGYRPTNSRESGRFRKVRVSVNREGAEVRAPRGYYEARPFDKQSGREKSIGLYGALLSEAPSELPVLAGFSFFAAPEGRTAMVFSAGVRPGDLARKNEKSPELEATVLVSVQDRVFNSMPVLLEQELRPEVTRDFLERAAEDETMSLSYNGRIDLSPGRYSFKVLLRDDRSGRMGAFEQAVDVPSFTGDSVASSLLLTRQVQPRGRADGEAEGKESPEDEGSGRDLLGVGELSLTPEPGRAFRQGHVIYGVYHLYNASEADFVVADQGMQIALQRDGEWYTDAVSAGGQPYPDRSARVIRYVAWVDTEKLPPGHYTLVAVLPNYQTREVPDLSEEFEVVLAAGAVTPQAVLADGPTQVDYQARMERSCVERDAAVLALDAWTPEALEKVRQRFLECAACRREFMERSCVARDAAVLALAAWTPKALRGAAVLSRDGRGLPEALEKVRQGFLECAAYRREWKTRSPHGNPSQLDLECRCQSPPWAAAAVIHTIKALVSEPGAEDLFHLSFAERLLEEAGREALQRQWYLIAGLRSLRYFNLEPARSYLEQGLELFEDDPALLTALGTSYEVEAWRLRLVVRGVGLDRFARERHGLLAQQSRLWAKAADLYERALVQDAEHWEAHLRLGRVAVVLGRNAQGLENLRWVTKHAKEVDLIYLAHLFIGRELTESGEIAAALAAYRAALDADPRGQAASVATSHALLVSGNPALAAEVLERGLASRGSVLTDDSWWHYPEDRFDQVLDLVAQLHGEVCR